MDFLFGLHFVATVALAGLIWTIQIVHYPSFKWVESHHFADFHRFHSRSISLIVIPLMLLELGTAAVLLLRLPTLWMGVNLGSILAIWLATFFVSVPYHNQLEKNGRDMIAIAGLVKTNWIRTAIWSGRVMGLSLLL